MLPSHTHSEKGANGDLEGNTHHDGGSILEGFLACNPEVRFIRLQWQDLAGLLRARIVPVDIALSLAKGQTRLVLSPVSLNLTAENSMIPSGNLIGGDVGFPDWNSLRTRRLLDPLYATVMCRIGSFTPERPEPNEKRCPRRALLDMVERAERQFQLSFLIGFEVEFEVLKADAHDRLAPYSEGLGRGSIGGLRDPSYPFVEEAVQTLLDSGVGIEAFHTEGRTGQYEFCLAPRAPMEAVDELIAVQDTLKEVFSRHGLIATMFPRPVPSRPESVGQHTHVSINRRELEEQFLAGMLKFLPALFALYLPYEFSYERLKPGQAGQFVTWGTGDRRGPVRRIKPGHWEIRCVDGTTNMYLCLAATLSAGLIGCQTQEPLLLPDCGFDPASNHAEGAPLPRNLEEGLTELSKEFQPLESMMGNETLQHYLDVKQHELRKLREMATEDARAWLTKIF